jgi:DNA-binding transcriptional ArsR family regulator
MEDDVKRLDNPRALRALSHPLRLRLLSALRAEGPATVSTLADQVDESPANVSYHLSKLHEHGFIEEAPELARDGREHWWRAAHAYTSWTDVEPLDDPERRIAANALTRTVLDRQREQIDRFVAEETAWGKEWVAAAQISNDDTLRLDPAALAAMTAELWAVIDKYKAQEPAPDAERVRVIFHAFPQRRGS